MTDTKDAIAVIGLGRFGKAVARALAKNGKSVLALDADQKLIDQIAPEVEACACVDSTDIEALKELEIGTFEVVVIGIGDSAKEASILTTSQVATLGVKHIVARATDDLHARVLKAVGAHEIVNPEGEIGTRLGRRLVHPSLLEEVQLGDGAVLVEVDVPKVWFAKTLIELDLRRKQEINVVAIKKRDGHILPNPLGTQILNEGDIIIAIGSPRSVDRLSKMRQLDSASEE